MNAFEYRASVNELRERLRNDYGSPRRWSIIREYYDLAMPMIDDGYRVSPYELGLSEFMTPIERELWIDIRLLALPVYFQFPVGRRFVDFGDPVRHLAIECDGAAYHDEERDEQRDDELRAIGWNTIRVSGRNCVGLRGTVSVRKIAEDYYGMSFDDEGEQRESF